jgi:hypothetical protein
MRWLREKFNMLRANPNRCFVCGCPEHHAVNALIPDPLIQGQHAHKFCEFGSCGVIDLEGVAEAVVFPPGCCNNSQCKGFKLYDDCTKAPNNLNIREAQVRRDIIMHAYEGGDDSLVVLQGGEHCAADLVTCLSGSRAAISFDPAEDNGDFDVAQLKCMTDSFWQGAKSGEPNFRHYWHADCAPYPGHLMIFAARDNWHEYYFACRWEDLHATQMVYMDGFPSSERVLCLTANEKMHVDTLATDQAFTINQHNFVKLDLDGVIEALTEHHFRAAGNGNLENYYTVMCPVKASHQVAYESMVYHIHHFFHRAGIEVSFPIVEGLKTDCYLRWPNEHTYFSTQLKTFSLQQQPGCGPQYFLGLGCSRDGVRGPYSSHDMDLLVCLHQVAVAHGQHAADGALPPNTQDMLMMNMKRLIVEKKVRVTTTGRHRWRQVGSILTRRFLGERTARGETLYTDLPPPEGYTPTLNLSIAGPRTRSNLIYLNGTWQERAWHLNRTRILRTHAHNTPARQFLAAYDGSAKHYNDPNFHPPMRSTNPGSDYARYQIVTFSPANSFAARLISKRDE